MELNLPEKVLKYESFLNDVLKEQLKVTHNKLEKLGTEMSEYVQLKNYIETLKDAELENQVLKTQVDIGCGFYIQANIENPKLILVAIGCDCFVEFSLDEALNFVKSRLDYMEKQTEIYKQQSSNTKAHIKLVLLGLMELQKL